MPSPQAARQRERPGPHADLARLAGRGRGRAGAGAALGEHHGQVRGSTRAGGTQRRRRGLRAHALEQRGGRRGRHRARAAAQAPRVEEDPRQARRGRGRARRGGRRAGRGDRRVQAVPVRVGSAGGLLRRRATGGAHRAGRRNSGACDARSAPPMRPHVPGAAARAPPDMSADAGRAKTGASLGRGAHRKVRARLGQLGTPLGPAAAAGACWLTVLVGCAAPAAARRRGPVSAELPAVRRRCLAPRLPCGSSAAAGPVCLRRGRCGRRAGARPRARSSSAAHARAARRPNKDVPHLGAARTARRPRLHAAGRRRRPRRRWPRHRSRPRRLCRCRARGACLSLQHGACGRRGAQHPAPPLVLGQLARLVHDGLLGQLALRVRLAERLHRGLRISLRKLLPRII